MTVQPHDHAPHHTDHDSDHDDHAPHEHDHTEHEEHEHEGHDHREHRDQHDHADHADHADHEHDDHKHATGLWASVATALHLPGYAHQHEGMAQDSAVYSNKLAIRTVQAALVILGVTTLLQIGVVAISGSVALLGDTIHNLGDTLNSIPLLLAFWLNRRKPNRRYTYGYGRAEDVAGLVIVVSIAVSAAVIFWESIQKLLHPEPLQNLLWVAAAAIIGFLGNEGVALLQINVGKQIGSEAMVTDGQHARIDGLTSLAVLAAALGSALGFPIVDPIIGLVIGVVIIFIARSAILATWYRLMDAVDPELVDKAETAIKQHGEVKQIHRLQMRWLGHRLHMETVLGVEANLPTEASEAVIDHITHDLYHAIPNLGEVTVGLVPWSTDGKQTYWRETQHHRDEFAQPEK